MRISVALAAKNGERFLLDQVASILMQLAPPRAAGLNSDGIYKEAFAGDELIISVDPSEDNTLALARQFAQSSPIIKVVEGPGKGVIANFQNAICLATGDLIFLADQDDVWLPGKVAEISAAFQMSSIAVLLHDAIVTDENLTPIHHSYFELRGTNKGQMNNIIQNHFVGACMAFRSEFRRWILPFPPNIPMHDQWIGVMAERYGAVAFYRKQLIKYRRHGANATQLERLPTGLIQMMKWRGNLFMALNERAAQVPEWAMCYR
ncbi:MAG: glycosyltransferase family 2 protein [Coriobacteriales bacterium]|nr:glycosyltransferase family 2 protein [Coriobacteriales bacterium]